MIRSLSRRSRRFVPGGVPAGLRVEHLEVRAMMDGDSSSEPPLSPEMEALVARLDDTHDVNTSGPMVYAECAAITQPDKAAVIKHLRDTQKLFNDQCDAANVTYDQAITRFTQKRDGFKDDVAFLKGLVAGGDNDPRIPGWIT